MGIIYCYTNLINGKKYVGQTINPEKRYNQHKSSAFNEKDKDYNTPLHRAFRKYGYNNFNYEIILSTSSLDILNELEIYFIDKYLIEGGVVDQEWFRRYKLEPYLSQKFPYHIRSVNHANLRLR